MSPYARLLREDWDALAPGVRRAMTPPLFAEGELRIQRAETGVAGKIARRIELPPPGPAVPTRLVLAAEGDTVRWERTFDGMRAVSEQRISAEGVFERAGPFEFELRMESEGDALVHRQRAVRLGGRRLPALFAPRVEGTLSAGPDDSNWNVCVIIGHPVFGTICRYDGLMRALD